MEIHRRATGASAPVDLNMNPSDRIKAALARPEAARTSSHSPAMRPSAAVETTLPLLGVSDTTPVALPSDGISSETPPLDSVDNVESGQPAGAGTRQRRARQMYLALTCVVLVVIAVVMIRQRTTVPNQVSAPPTLQVVVTQASNGVLSVRWNPQSAPIAKAREGRLVMLEPNQPPKIIQLQTEELRIGHVYYQSLAERLEIRLEVVQASGAVVKESVLAVSSGTAAAIAAPSQPADVQSSKPSPLAPEPPPPATTVADVPQPSQPAPRIFTPPPPQAAQQPIEEPRTVLLDPSATQPVAITAPARVNLPPLGGVPALPGKPPAPQAPATNRTLTIGGTVEPATLLKRVSPVYPAIARSARIQGLVKFTAVVDKTGKVQNLHFVSGPQMLVQAASDAVKKWTYRPMMLNGKPAEVITQIEVKFSLAQ